MDLQKKSAKKVFNSLDENIVITKIFLNHITNISTKDRSYREIIERILIIPFVQEALECGEFVESRNKHSLNFKRIEYKS